MIILKHAVRVLYDDGTVPHEKTVLCEAPVEEKELKVKLCPTCGSEEIGKHQGRHCSTEQEFVPGTKHGYVCTEGHFAGSMA